MEREESTLDEREDWTPLDAKEESTLSADDANMKETEEDVAAQVIPLDGPPLRIRIMNTPPTPQPLDGADPTAFDLDGHGGTQRHNNADDSASDGPAWTVGKAPMHPRENSAPRNKPLRTPNRPKSLNSISTVATADNNTTVCENKRTCAEQKQLSAALMETDISSL